MKFLKIHVLEPEDLKMLIEDGECTSINDIDCNKVDFTWDYHQVVLLDTQSNMRLYWNDNMHTHIEDDIGHFIKGVEYALSKYGETVEVQETAMLQADVENNYGGVEY
jgi:hypothetical protein